MLPHISSGIKIKKTVFIHTFQQENLSGYVFQLSLWSYFFIKPQEQNQAYYKTLQKRYAEGNAGNKLNENAVLLSYNKFPMHNIARLYQMQWKGFPDINDPL